MIPGNGWKAEITDPEEKPVFEALSDPHWDFRTIDGISKATRLTREQVTTVLEKYPALVRRSLVPDREGRALFTLRSRPISAQERLAEARLFISKSVA